MVSQDQNYIAHKLEPAPLLRYFTPLVIEIWIDKKRTALEGGMTVSDGCLKLGPSRVFLKMAISEKDTESCSVEPLIDYPIKGMFSFKSHPSKIHKTLYLFSLGCGTLSLHTQ